MAINRPFKNGLLLKGAYTLSRAKNETDDDGWAGLNWNAPSQLSSRNYALAGYDRPHVFQMAFVYELPYKTTPAAATRWRKVVLGDWQVNGIYSAYSGTPFTITASGADLNMPGNTQTANLNGDYKVLDKHGDAGILLRPDGVQPATGVTFGNTGRNQFRGPGDWNVDFSLFRAFPIMGGTKRVEFRVEFFNLLNHPNWGNPPTTTSTSTAPTSARRSPSGTGARDAGTGERQIRFGLAVAVLSDAAGQPDRA